ncbi:MAG: acetylornithine deacetylase [Candidatus Atribacteria bacterium]|nr:acetylornithine deacetylase [Candidatus Atribacteria bacterium]
MADWKSLLDSEFDLFQPIHLAQNLVRIASVSRTKGEIEIARYISNYFIDRGIKVEWQEVEEGRANIIAEVEGSLGEGPCLVLNGHLDTVPVGSGWTFPPLGGQIVGNLLYGRGACDMKGALAAMMYAAYLVSLFSHSLYGKLKLVFVVDEEQDNIGMKEWITTYQKSGEQVDFALVGEPTGLNVSLGHRGVAAYRVSIKGKSCHVGIAEEGQNAIYPTCSIIRKLEEENQKLKEFNDLDLGCPSLQVGLIKGGVSPNVVPETCQFEVDVRTLPDFSLDRLREIIQEAIITVQRERREDFPYQIDQSIPLLPPVKISRELKGIEILAKTIHDVPGEIPIFAPFPASCEASFLFQAGIPTAIFGPGRITEAHTANEFVSTTQVVGASRIYALLALRFLGND